MTQSRGSNIAATIKRAVDADIDISISICIGQRLLVEDLYLGGGGAPTAVLNEQMARIYDEEDGVVGCHQYGKGDAGRELAARGDFVADYWLTRHSAGGGAQLGNYAAAHEQHIAQMSPALPPEQKCQRVRGGYDVLVGLATDFTLYAG